MTHLAGISFHSKTPCHEGWDIEAFSASGRFPVADNPGDKLIQIATAFQRYGELEPYHRAVVCLRQTDHVEGAEIIWTDHEHEVIGRWAQLLRDHKTDIALGYNTAQFDWRYISGRAGVLVDDVTGDPLVDLELLGRMVDGGGEVREFELNSGAYGQNKFFVLQTPGVQQLDLLQYVRREYKLDSYSLDNVSKKFLGAQKLDLPAAQIFAKFDGTAADRADIARYAVRDTELPLRLVAKLCVWENLTEMANAVNVPVDYLLNRGQQVRGFSGHAACSTTTHRPMACTNRRCRTHWGTRWRRTPWPTWRAAAADQGVQRHPGQGAAAGVRHPGRRGHRRGGGRQVRGRHGAGRQARRLL